MPLVDIDAESGFCFGVVTAIRKAEEELEKGEPLHCLGDIVHNSDEVERLRRKGLDTITHADLEGLADTKVLLRAHGEPPETYSIARRNNIEIVDATCPVVLKLQKRIKATCDAEPHTQIVIYGKAGHAEVNGLVGQTGGRAIVVEDIEGLDKVDFSRNIALYSQTTMSLEGFRSVIDEIGRRKLPEASFRYFDTICRSVANRAEHLRDFAAARAAVLFVAGTKSSNGRILYEHCRQVNPATYLVENETCIPFHLLPLHATIGICGATSTPRWLMERVKDAVEAYLESSAS